MSFSYEKWTENPKILVLFRKKKLVKILSLSTKSQLLFPAILKSDHFQPRAGQQTALSVPVGPFCKLLHTTGQSIALFDAYLNRGQTAEPGDFVPS